MDLTGTLLQNACLFFYLHLWRFINIRSNLILWGKHKNKHFLHIDSFIYKSINLRINSWWEYTYCEHIVFIFLTIEKHHTFTTCNNDFWSCTKLFNTKKADLLLCNSFLLSSATTTKNLQKEIHKNDLSYINWCV